MLDRWLISVTSTLHTSWLSMRKRKSSETTQESPRSRRPYLTTAVMHASAPLRASSRRTSDDYFLKLLNRSSSKTRLTRKSRQLWAALEGLRWKMTLTRLCSQLLRKRILAVLSMATQWWAAGTFLVPPWKRTTNPRSSTSPCPSCRDDRVQLANKTIAAFSTSWSWSRSCKTSDLTKYRTKSSARITGRRASPVESTSSLNRISFSPRDHLPRQTFSLHPTLSGRSQRRSSAATQVRMPIWKINLSMVEVVRVRLRASISRVVT